MVVREFSNQTTRRKHYQVTLHLYPLDEYSTEYQVKRNAVHNVLGTRLSYVLQKELGAELKRLEIDMKTQRAEIGKGRAPRDLQDFNEGEEGEEGDAAPRDDRSEVGDGDAEDEKHERQTKEQTSYSDDESDEDEEDDENSNLIDDEAEEDSDEEDEGGGKKSKKKKKKDDDDDEKLRNPRDVFLSVLPAAVDFNFKNAQCNFILEVCLLPTITRACS